MARTLLLAGTLVALLLLQLSTRAVPSTTTAAPLEVVWRLPGHESFDYSAFVDRSALAAHDAHRRARLTEHGLPTLSAVSSRLSKSSGCCTTRAQGGGRRAALRASARQHRLQAVEVEEAQEAEEAEEEETRLPRPGGGGHDRRMRRSPRCVSGPRWRARLPRRGCSPSGRVTCWQASGPWPMRPQPRQHRRAPWWRCARRTAPTSPRRWTAGASCRLYLLWLYLLWLCLLGLYLIRTAGASCRPPRSASPKSSRSAPRRRGEAASGFGHTTARASRSGTMAPPTRTRTAARGRPSR